MRKRASSEGRSAAGDLGDLTVVGGQVEGSGGGSSSWRGLRGASFDGAVPCHRGWRCLRRHRLSRWGLSARRARTRARGTRRALRSPAAGAGGAGRSGRGARPPWGEGRVVIVTFNDPPD